MLEVERKNRILYKQVFFARESEIYLLSPHGIRETKRYLSQELQWVWKMLQVVEDWVLITPPSWKWWSRVRLLQRVTACLSISTVLTVLHLLERPGHPQSSDVSVEEPEHEVFEFGEPSDTLF